MQHDTGNLDQATPVISINTDAEYEIVQQPKRRLPRCSRGQNADCRLDNGEELEAEVTFANVTNQRQLIRFTITYLDIQHSAEFYIKPVLDQFDSHYSQPISQFEYFNFKLPFENGFHPNGFEIPEGQNIDFYFMRQRSVNPHHSSYYQIKHVSFDTTGTVYGGRYLPQLVTDSDILARIPNYDPGFDVYQVTLNRLKSTDHELTLVKPTIVVNTLRDHQYLKLPAIVLRDLDYPIQPLPDPEIETEACCSNVAFLHGVQAAYLHAGDSNRVWPALHNGDFDKLSMDGSGESVHHITVGPSITKFANKNVYDNLHQQLDSLVADGVIEEWSDLSYDWRKDPFSIVDELVNRHEVADYYFIDEIQRLAASSKTGKVSLVTHSYGGMVGKALMIRLEEMGLEDLIDTIVFTVPPFQGTPKGLAAVLHGYQQGLGILVPATDRKGREVAQNLASAYHLMPNEVLVNDKWGEDFYVEFDDDNEHVYSLFNDYGSQINNFTEYQQFLSNNADRNYTTGDYDLNNPGPINKMLWQRAINNHNRLNAWQPPVNTAVSVIAGYGLSTANSISYDAIAIPGSLFGANYRLVSQINTTYSGDETVVLGSTDSDYETYYFDQKSYAANQKVKSPHAEFFKADSVTDCVADLIQNTGCEDQYLTSTRPNLPPTRLYQVAAHSPVSIVATDKKKQQTGVINGEQISDIPGSAVEVLGGSTFIILPTLDEIEFNYQYDPDSGHVDNLVTFSISTMLSAKSNSRQTNYTDSYVISPDTSGQLVINNVDDDLQLVPTVAMGQLPTVSDYLQDQASPDLANAGGGGSVMEMIKQSGRVSNDRGKVLGQAAENSSSSNEKLTNLIELIRKIINLSVDDAIKRYLLVKLLLNHE